MEMNKNLKRKILRSLACTVLSLLAFGSAKASANEESSCADLKAANAQLEQTYKQLLLKYRSDAVFLGKLKKSQKSWTAYRDAQLELVFPVEKSAEYGTVYPECNCQILYAMTQSRIRELDQWLTGIEEGDVCTGSRPVKN